jgi:hypothetical protein
MELQVDTNAATSYALENGPNPTDRAVPECAALPGFRRHICEAALDAARQRASRPSVVPMAEKGLEMGVSRPRTGIESRGLSWFFSFLGKTVGGTSILARRKPDRPHKNRLDGYASITSKRNHRFGWLHFQHLEICSITLRLRKIVTIDLVDPTLYKENQNEKDHPVSVV